MTRFAPILIAVCLVLATIAGGFHVGRQVTANECQAHLSFVVGGARYVCVSVASLPIPSAAAEPQARANEYRF